MHEDNFQPPERDDYKNVEELNRIWLAMRHSLKAPQRARLAAAPFLLFSLREDDLSWWRRALEPQAELTVAEPASAELRHLQCAALAFLWHLARRNEYAARAVSGASSDWCERIASLPLARLLRHAATRTDLCRSRLHGAAIERNDSDWVVGETPLRRATHLAALHELLTLAANPEMPPLPAAACRFRGPRLRIMRG